MEEATIGLGRKQQRRAWPYLTLIGAINDATGTVPWVLFREQEDAHGYLELLRSVVLTRGIPLALYVDRHGIFKKCRREPLTVEEELADGRLPAQVGRARGGGPPHRL